MLSQVMGSVQRVLSKAPSLRGLSTEFFRFISNRPLTSAGATLGLAGSLTSVSLHYSFAKSKKIEREGIALVGESGGRRDGYIGKLYDAFERDGVGNLLPQKNPSANELARVMSDLRDWEEDDDARLASLEEGMQGLRRPKYLKGDIRPLSEALEELEAIDDNYQERLSTYLSEIDRLCESDKTGFRGLQKKVEDCDNFETLRGELDQYCKHTKRAQKDDLLGSGLKKARAKAKKLINRIDKELRELDETAICHVETVRDAITVSRENVNASKAQAFNTAYKFGKSTGEEMEVRDISESFSLVLSPAIVGLALFGAALAVRQGALLRGLNIRWLQ